MIVAVCQDVPCANNDWNVRKSIRKGVYRGIRIWQCHWREKQFGSSTLDQMGIIFFHPNKCIELTLRVPCDFTLHELMAVFSNLQMMCVGEETHCEIVNGTAAPFWHGSMSEWRNDCDSIRIYVDSIKLFQAVMTKLSYDRSSASVIRTEDMDETAPEGE